MNLEKRPIIGIKGCKGSGKDTVASMIHYIISVGPTQADFNHWEKFDKRPKDDLDVPTIHFADKIKDDLSAIFGINRECFDNREYKDDKYYCFELKAFLTSKMLKDVTRPEITFEDLQKNNLAKWRESYGDTCVIKLRTLMQYYGTELIRNQLGADAWINVAINKARSYKNYYGYAIIADVRFRNESSTIYCTGGKIIHLIKDTNNKIEHSSENIKSDDRDYVIVNNGTLLGLFYKVLEFVKEYIM